MSRRGTVVHEIARLMVEACEGDADVQVCWRYRDQLVGIGKPAVAVLIPLLAHSSAGVRLHAVDALGRIGDPLALTALELVCDKDPDVEVQAAAVEALGRLRGANRVEPLLRALRASDFGKRMDAVRALARLRSPIAVPKLMEVAGSLVNSGNTVAAAYVRTAAAYADRGLPALESVLNSPDSDFHDRVAAVSLLDLSSSAEAVGIVLAQLSDADEQLRASALETLGRLINDLSSIGIGSSKAISTGLASIFERDPSGRNRMAAAAILGSLADPEMLPLMEQVAATDPHEPTRRWAAKAAQRMNRSAKQARP